jgi:methylmalonyl-CoA decarboxylase subunit alpha
LRSIGGNYDFYAETRYFFTKKSTIAKGGGDKAIGKQKAGGKMTARERIATLLDPGSFHEYDLFVEHNCQDFGMGDKELAADGVITGSSSIGGRMVCIHAQDFTVAGGSLGLMHARKITKVMDHAIKMGMRSNRRHELPERGEV